MARNYYVNGQCLVRVRGMIGSDLDIEKNNGSPYELGITDGRGKVTISPNFRHHEIKYDDWGGAEGHPPDVLQMLTDVDITMTLVHFDKSVLSSCITESIGGGSIEGRMEGAGKPIGAGAEMYSANNHYITLFLSSLNTGENGALGFANTRWRFKACYLAGKPIEWPLGAERSLVRCHWRAIPYRNFVVKKELTSNLTIVWDHLPDFEKFE